MKRSVVSFLISLAVLSPAVAAADEPKTAEPEWKVQQRRQLLFDEGLKLVEKERYREALEKFRDVIRLRHHPRVYLYIALCEDKLGDPIKARAIYVEAKQDAQARKLDDVAADAVNAIADVSLRIPRVIVRADAPGPLQVLLDSARVPLQPGGRLEMNPGKHVIIVSAAGRTSFHTQIEIKPSEEKIVEAHLPEVPIDVSKPPSPKAVPVGGIVVASGGGVLLISGAVCLGLGYRDGDTTLKVGGWVQVPTSLLMLGAGIGWAVYETRSAAKPASASILSNISLAAAPLPGGAWLSAAGTIR